MIVRDKLRGATALEQGRASGGARRRAGMAMASTVITVFATAAMVGVMLTLATSQNKVADVRRFDTEARYLAEGALEIARKELQTDLANWSLPQNVYETDVAGVAVPVQVTPSGFVQAQADPSGIQTWLVGYVLRATAASGDSVETVRELITAEATPIFQFAVFYTNDLEIHPGPNMTLGGRVHSNQDMYLSTGGSTVTMDTNYLRSVGDIFRSRKYKPLDSKGNINIRKWVLDPYDSSEPSEFVPLPSLADLMGEGIASSSGYDSDFMGYDGNLDGDFDDLGDYLPWVYGALEYWKQPDGYTTGSGTTVLTGDHGIGEAVTPQIESISKFEPLEGGSYDYDNSSETYYEVPAGTGEFGKAFFHREAGLTIQTKVDGSFEAYDASGLDVTGTVAPAVTVEKIYDARQGGDVTVAVVDMDKLGTLAAWPANNLIYACSEHVDDGIDCGGVMLTNGEALVQGVTVVAEGALYVQGDYNTVGKKGAAVIADAVNLLSNTWNGSKSSSSSLPRASDTTFNLAIVTGNQDTTAAKYNGGLENLPRFHENWSGKDCNIVGSFVNTWRSDYCDGAWKYGGKNYTAPIRNWSYDEAFNSLANLPPYTPMAVSAVTVVRW